MDQDCSSQRRSGPTRQSGSLLRAARQHRPIRRADDWWAVLLGLLLLALNVDLYFRFWLSSVLGWPILWADNFLLQMLLYFWLSFLCCFLVGGLRAYFTGQTHAILRLSVRSELVGIVPVIVLSEAIGFSWGPLVGLAAHSEIARHLVSFGDDMAPVEFIVDGFYLAPILGGLQLLVSIVEGVIGGAWLGSHLRHQQRALD